MGNPSDEPKRLEEARAARLRAWEANRLERIFPARPRREE